MKTVVRQLKQGQKAVRQVWSWAWARATLYVLAIPLFPEYLAPVLTILSLIAAVRCARQEGRTIVIGTAGKALLAYIVYQAVTVPFAELPLNSLAFLALWILMFLGYLAVTTAVCDRTRLDTALYWLCLVTGLVGLVGCVQYFLRFIGLNTPLQFWEPLDTLVYSYFPVHVNLLIDGVRVSSTFSNPNLAGQYMMLTVPFVAWYSFHGNDKRNLTLCRFCLLAAIGCAGFTFSRGTYLALIMGALVLVVANWRRIVKTLLAILATVLLIPDAVWNRLMSVGQMDPSSLERLNVWGISLELIAKKPLFGYGCGLQYVWNVLVANGIGAPHAHNLILQLLLEGGFVGLFLMLFVGIRFMQNAFQLVSRKDDRSFGAMLLVFFVGFCVNAMVEDIFAFPKLIGIFGLILAITDCVAGLKLSQAPVPLRQTLTFWKRWLATDRLTEHR